MNGGPEGVQLAVLVVAGALVSVLELMFQYAYIGPVPLPLGTVVILLTMPWLVRTTVEVWPSAAGAAAQPVLWFVVTAAIGAFGPGGDWLLVPAWQTVVLLATGVLVGMIAFRRAVDRLASEGAADPSSDGDRATGRALDPRIRGAGRSS